jgi:hypothetical protein
VADVASYDFTFGERIGWKWDAVLRELRLRGWAPPSGPVLDWGCGGGIAGRRVLGFLGSEQTSHLRLFDQSGFATEFAAAAARRSFPRVTVEVVSAAQLEALPAVGLLLVSHVLNELDEPGGRALRGLIERADAVLWVEPVTFADSRALIAMRESLREEFNLIAPCSHQAACGLLSSVNHRHWCHHFAPAPPGIMSDSNWVRFAQRAGIDLRRLPYSFLALERRGVRTPVPGTLAPGWSRVVGDVRTYKGFTKILSCQAEGVAEFELQKRVDPGLFKAFKDGEAGPLWRWRLEAGRIVELADLEHAADR